MVQDLLDKICNYKNVIAGQITQNAIDGVSYLSPWKTMSSIQAFQVEEKHIFLWHYAYIQTTGEFSPVQ